MAKGYSYESFGAEIEVGRATLYVWERRYEEWKQAKEVGHEMALRAWEQLAVAKARGQKITLTENSVIDGKRMDGPTINFMLKTRFRKVYKIVETIEHTEVEKPSEEEIDLAKAIQLKMPKKQKKEMIDAVKAGIKKKRAKGE